MVRFYQIIQGVVATLLTFAAVSAWAGEIEAKKDGVSVTAAPDKAAEVIATLKAGQTLTAGERKGMYWEVKTADGKPGFVSVMAVKHKPAGDGGLGAAIREAVKDGRNVGDAANARARSAVMGVRGLDDSGETAFAGSVKPDLRAVYSMEDFAVAPNQVERLGEDVFSEISRRAAKKNEK